MKKIFILVFILIIIFLIMFLMLKEKNIKDLTIQNKLNFYSNKKIIEKPVDELEEFFNNMLITAEKINGLKYVELSIEELKSPVKTINEIKNKIKELDLNVLEKNIYELIKNYNEEEKTEILKIYENSEVYLNKSFLLNKAYDYKNNLFADLEFLTILNNNKENYYIENDVLVCKNDNLKNKLNKFKNKIKIKKEEIFNKKVPILMYHGVLDEPWGLEKLFVKVKDFENQMNYLQEKKYTTLFLSEIKTAKNYEKVVIITFDDGYKGIFENAFPILKKYNLKANLFVITSTIGGGAYVNKEMILEMSNSGMIEIGSHTVNHPALSKLDEKEIEKELRDSKKYLEDLLNKKVNTLAYPYGSFNQNVINISKKYYDYALSTIPGKEIVNNLNDYSLKRINIYRDMSLKTYKKYLP